MKKLVMGMMSALMLITSPAWAFDSWDRFWIDSGHENLDEITFHDNGVQWYYENTVHGFTMRISGTIDSTTVGLWCGQTVPQMDALTIEQHANFMNGVAAADWWYDESDAYDSFVYWRDQMIGNADFTLSGLTGVLGLVNDSGADWMAARACYSYWMGLSISGGIDRYITLRPDTTYNQKVRAMIAAGS